MAGQSDPHLSLFSPSEVEFVAEDEIVEIVPNIRMEALNMICGAMSRWTVLLLVCLALPVVAVDGSSIPCTYSSTPQPGPRLPSPEHSPAPPGTVYKPLTLTADLTPTPGYTPDGPLGSVVGPVDSWLLPNAAPGLSVAWRAAMLAAV